MGQAFTKRFGYNFYVAIESNQNSLIIYEPGVGLSFGNWACCFC